MQHAPAAVPDLSSSDDEETYDPADDWTRPLGTVDALLCASPSEIDASPCKGFTPAKRTPRRTLDYMSPTAAFYDKLSPLGAAAFVRHHGIAFSPFGPSPMSVRRPEMESPAIPLPGWPMSATRRLTFPSPSDTRGFMHSLDLGVKDSPMPEATPNSRMKFKIEHNTIHTMTPLSDGFPTPTHGYATLVRNLAAEHHSGDESEVRVEHTVLEASISPPRPVRATSIATPPPVEERQVPPPAPKPRPASHSHGGSAAAAVPAAPSGPAGSSGVSAAAAALAAANASSSSSSKKQTPCHCKRSKCLKLYCECFAAGRLCTSACHCNQCCNADEHDKSRVEAINSTLERNPHAFKPKIQAAGVTQHAKGCHCKKSGCKKKYCECFQAGIPCGENCKCTTCKNTHDHRQSCATDDTVPRVAGAASGGKSRKPIPGSASSGAGASTAGSSGGGTATTPASLKRSRDSTPPSASSHSSSHSHSHSHSHPHMSPPAPKAPRTAHD